MPLINLNHLYKCRHCKTIYVILRGHYKYSYIPVEVKSGNEKNDCQFDKEKHTSHLLNCPQLQKQWNEVKKIIIDYEKKLDRRLMK